MVNHFLTLLLSIPTLVYLLVSFGAGILSPAEASALEGSRPSVLLLWHGGARVINACCDGWKYCSTHASQMTELLHMLQGCLQKQV